MLKPAQHPNSRICPRRALLRPVAFALSAAVSLAVAITLWSGDLASTALIILCWLGGGLAVGFYMAHNN